MNTVGCVHSGGGVHGSSEQVRGWQPRGWSGWKPKLHLGL